MPDVIVDGNVHLSSVSSSDHSGWTSDWDPDATLSLDGYRSQMAAAGITHAVLVTGVRTDGLDNTRIAQALRRHPDIFAGVANVDVLKRGATDEMARLAELGFAGLRLYGGDMQDAAGWLDDPRARAAWREAERLGVVLSAQRTRMATLPALRFLLDEFPEVPVVVYSLADPPLQDGAAAPLLELARCPNLYLHASPANLMQAVHPAHPRAVLLKALAGAFGPRRLLWGSYSMFRGARCGPDSPSLAMVVQGVRAALNFLDPPGSAAVLGGTARGLYSTKGRAHDW